MMRRFAAALLIALSTMLATTAMADPFPRPAELEPAIRFWIKVYAQVSTQGGLLHDRENLEVIYETIRFDEDANRSARRNHVNEQREHYQQILHTLSQGKRTGLSAEERRVLEHFPDGVDNATLRRAADQIRFQLGQSDRFRRGLIRAGAWEPHIRRTLQEMDLPPQIAALPHVESSFNPNAYSRVGAAGIWQFTRATGRRFMRVDQIVDERMDPFESSVAAARLLQHNYSVTGEWGQAITAYNHGLAGIRRAARATGSDDIADIIREYEGRNWGFASRNFYPAFLAAVDVDFQAHKYFGLLDRDDPIVSETIELPFYASINDIIDAFEAGRSELYELNRALRPPVWNGEKRVPRGYTLRVPAGAERLSAEEGLARIEADRRFYAQVPDRHHTVARGESLSAIAQKYGISTRRLVSLNNLRSADMIRVGQELRLPVQGVRPIESDVYIVQHGDSLSRIAQRAGMSVGALAAANRIDPTRPIHPGQELRVDGRPVDDDATTTVAETATDAPGPSANEQVAPPATEQDGAEYALSEPITLDADNGATTVAEADTAASNEASEGASPNDLSTTAELVTAVLPAGLTNEPAEGTATASQTDGPSIALVAGSVLAEQAEQTSERPPRYDGEHELASDPSEYGVRPDGTIEVQAAETLGHYAEWLDLRASELRRINDMRHGSPVVIGTRIALRFDHVEPEEFEHRRQTYHEALQARFFDQFHITDTEQQEIQRGDSLWTLARRQDNVPVWLLRQYNPDLDFDRLQPGMPVNLPLVERHEEVDKDDQLAVDDRSQ